MCNLRLLELQDIWLVLCITLYVIHIGVSQPDLRPEYRVRAAEWRELWKLCEASQLLSPDQKLPAACSASSNLNEWFRTDTQESTVIWINRFHSYSNYCKTPAYPFYAISYDWGHSTTLPGEDPVRIVLSLETSALPAGAISVVSPQRSMTRSVQEDVVFSVRVTCQGVPTLQWTFMSGAVSRSIGSWRPDGGGGVGGKDDSFTNITVDYVDRVETYANGSLGLARLRLQDAGFYVLTVTEDSGSSRDSGFVLKVNEVIYEDLQYLSVSALVLVCLAGLLMLSMWLLNRAYKKIKSCIRHRKQRNGNETELQPL